MASKTKQGALTAARKALGADAVENVHFVLRSTGTGWEHAPMSPVTEAAKKARAKLVKAAKPVKAKAAPKRQAAKVAPEPRTIPTATAPDPDSKTDMLKAMMARPSGATSKEMEAAAGWKPESVRGLIGAMKKKGTTVTSTKVPGSPTVYRIGVAPAPTQVDLEDVL